MCHEKRFRIVLFAEKLITGFFTLFMSKGPRCSFCGKPEKRAFHLVYANVAYICDECVEDDDLVTIYKNLCLLCSDDGDKSDPKICFGCRGYCQGAVQGVTDYKNSQKMAQG